MGIAILVWYWYTLKQVCLLWSPLLHCELPHTLFWVLWKVLGLWTDVVNTITSQPHNLFAFFGASKQKTSVTFIYHLFKTEFTVVTGPQWTPANTLVESALLEKPRSSRCRSILTTVRSPLNYTMSCVTHNMLSPVFADTQQFRSHVQNRVMQIPLCALYKDCIK